MLFVFFSRREMRLQWPTSSYPSSAVGRTIVTQKMRRNSSSYRTSMISSPWAGYMWVEMGRFWPVLSNNHDLAVCEPRDQQLLVVVNHAVGSTQTTRTLCVCVCVCAGNQLNWRLFPVFPRLTPHRRPSCPVLTSTHTAPTRWCCQRPSPSSARLSSTSESENNVRCGVKDFWRTRF